MPVAAPWVVLKIEIGESNGNGLKLRLAGRLVGPWVDELRRCCDEAVATGARIELDFSDVAFVDRQGGRLIRSLHGRATLVHCSPFVREQLKAWQAG